MIILDNTTGTIQAVLGGAITTNQPDYWTGYVDHTTTTVMSGNGGGALNSTTDVNIVSAPAASTQRQVKYISIYNRDTVSVTATVKYDSSGTERILWKGVLAAGEKVEYIEASGWIVYDAYGNPRVTNFLIMPQGSPTKFYGIDAANLTAVKTLTSNSTFAYYMGPAPLAYSSITLRYRITTASATITWAEVGIASSPQITIAGAASLTRLGYTDVAAIINSTGQKSTAVAVTGVVPGMHLWALFGNQATTAAIVRGALADDLQSGFFQALGATRISTMGAGTAFAVEGATVVPVWGTWQGT